MYESPKQETTSTASLFIHRLRDKLAFIPTRGLFQQQTLTAIPVHTAYSGPTGRALPSQRESWRTLIIAWMRYQTIQTRWDIERRLARLFHRCWGNTHAGK